MHLHSNVKHFWLFFRISRFDDKNNKSNNHKQSQHKDDTFINLSDINDVAVASEM